MRKIGTLLCAVLAFGPAGLAGQAPDRVEAEVGGRKAALRVATHHGFPAVNGDELASGVLEGGSRSGGYFRARIRARDLVLEAGSPFFRYGDRSYQLANPPYIWGGSFWIPSQFVTDWMPAHTGAAPAVTTVEAARARRVDPDQSWRVVIDPGHGGRDPGTIGQRSREKDIVLAISIALRDELRKADRIEPFLTRDTDIYIPHDERSAFAVERGFETYFLGPARSEEAREVALRENRTPEVDGATPGSIDDRLFILTGLDRTENLSESRRFAGFVQNSLREARGSGVPDRGVKQGPWWVLLGALARMPSVIIEVGFVSNRSEEGYLSSAEGQREVARAIADAIQDYRADVLRRFGAADEDRR